MEIMIKKIIFKILKNLSLYLMKLAYDFIDADRDGLLSQKEIKEFTKKIKILLKGGN